MQKSILIPIWILVVLVAAAVAAFSYLSFEQFKLSQEQLKASQKQIEISQKAQYSEQFLKSVEQLASKDLGVFLVGAESLENLSRENAEEYKRVWKHLGNFLRYHQPLQAKAEKLYYSEPVPEIKAIAKMLRKRNTDYEHIRLDLSEANLEKAFLWRAHLWEANLEGANLWRANLWEANLEGADLEGADLEGADLRGVNLEGANLRGVDLEGADLEGANLRGVNLEGANLRGVDLEGADLVRANLNEASWSGANLFKVLFGGRIESGKAQNTLFRSLDDDLAQDLTNLTSEQLQGNYYDINYPRPKLPDGISEEDKPKAISVDEWREKYRSK